MKYERMEEDLAADAVSILMRMANLIDANIVENPKCIDVSISSRMVGYGYRAWSYKLRKIITLINSREAEIYNLLEKIEYLKSDLETRPNLDELSDKHQEEIWDHYKRLLEEERNEEDGE